MRSIELETALELILNSVQPKRSTEQISLYEALGRILAEDVYACIDNPPFDKSPLDGFALRSGDTMRLDKTSPLTFKVIDTIYAGSFSTKELNAFEAIRIMTGAKMPKGSDCVIRLEDVTEGTQGIVVSRQLEHFENYCFQGEDVRKGTLLFKKGTILNSIQLGVLGSMGLPKISVFERIKVGILVTGDEVIPSTERLSEGKIFDTNGIMLYGRLKELGANPMMIDSKEDDLLAISEAILNHKDKMDFLITTGGVSVGDKDILHEVMETLHAREIFWRVKLKPGTPAMYSMLEQMPILSLSGNPFAALATFELLGRPVLAKLSGDENLLLKNATGILQQDFKKKSSQRRFIRAIYHEGKVHLPKDGHASGKLFSMSGCNALIDIKAGSAGIFQHDQVEVLLL